ncbi:MAG TPA: D-alanine--D-alanine ligase [Candidatus Saccharimonadales bacterium]|nr:D-alanine--D-alanine ligase [Candidatus Saccharimonadales bacterium]
MTKVHVLCGGTSSEREVSLRSGNAVAVALSRAGFVVETFDLADADMAAIIACDVVFPVLHGKGGEDGVLQRQLEASSAKFVGSGSSASALCFDKWAYRQKGVPAGLPMAEATLVKVNTYRTHPLAAKPFVLKPVDGGSSIDTHIVRDVTQVPQTAIADSFSRHPELLMEALVEGSELTVGVLGNEALPVIEIIPPATGEFDYENKYNGASQELCPPRHIDTEVQARAQELALQAHSLTGCRHFSRTDIMYDRASDRLYILETNTIPGMTAQSLFPKMAASAGLDMPSLCRRLVEMALSV